MLKILIVCFAFLVQSKTEKITIHTKGQLMYSYFPLRVDRLEFSVKAHHDIHIVLTNAHRSDLSRYEVAFGGWGNSKSAIWRDGIEDAVVTLNGPVISPGQFQTYWVSINNTEGSVSAGMDRDRLLMHFTDPHFVKKSVFGISTAWGAHGVWNFDMEILRCSCGTIAEY